MPVPPSKPIGLILAGGQASRMGGGDKVLRRVAGRTILARIVARLRDQCSDVLISANGDPARFAAFALPVLGDPLPGFAGPLAGVLAGLDWANAQGRADRMVLSVSGDCPFLPADLATRLETARQVNQARMACALSGGVLHPTMAIWPAALCEPLRQALVDGRQSKVRAFQDAHGCARAEWPAEPFDPFFNVNDPDDLARAEAIAEHYPSA